MSKIYDSDQAWYFHKFEMAEIFSLSYAKGEKKLF